MKRKLLLLLIFVAAITAGLIIWHDKASAPGATNSTNKKQTATFNKSLYSTSEPGSIWWVVNKTRALSPLDYVPSDLVVPNIPIRPNAGSDERKVSAKISGALETMVATAKKDGVNLMLASGFRSYATQVAVYNNEVAQYGQAKADSESAKPGHSEHQTGLAADLEDAGRKCEVDDCFANTPEGKWVAAHAYEYGFILRYTEGNQASTGYRAESWHVRYVGKDLSTELHKNNQTMEQFFGL